MKSDPFAAELERLGPPVADDWRDDRSEANGARGTNGTGGMVLGVSRI